MLERKETLFGFGHPLYPAGDPRPVNLKGIAEPVEVVSIDWR